MADVRLTQQGAAPQAVSIDLLLTAEGQLDTGQELATAVTIALMTDALAAADDELPDARDPNRRGWWGDLDAGPIWDGWPIGSRLWLLQRTTITGTGARKGATTAQVKSYILDALQPFVDHAIATRLDVEVVRAGAERIEARIVLWRGGDRILDLRFADLWSGIAVAAPLEA